MGKELMIILIDKRREEAPVVQELLTEYGCLIQTRLGLHDGVGDRCSNQGLIIIEMVGERAQQKELDEKLNALDGVKAKLVDIAFD